MKVLAPFSQMLRAFEMVLPGVGGSKLVHNCLKLQAERGSGLQLMSSGSPVRIVSGWIDGAERSGAAVVLARPLARFLRSFSPDSKSQIEVTANPGAGEVVVGVGDAMLVLQTHPANDWPVAQAITSASVGILTSRDVANMRRVVFAASREAQDGVLEGVHLSGRYAFATDRYRMARAELGLQVPSATVPASAIRLLGRDASAGGLALYVEENAAEFRSEDGSAWTTQLVSGQYPSLSDLDQTEVRSRHSNLIFDTNALTECLERMLSGGAVGGEQRPSLVRIAPDAIRGVAEFSTEVPGLRISETLSLAGSYDSPIYFRARFLQEAVHAAESEKVCLEILGPLKPVRIPGEAFLQVMMPVSTPETRARD